MVHLWIRDRQGPKAKGLWGPGYQEVYCKPISLRNGCRTKTNKWQDQEIRNYRQLLTAERESGLLQGMSDLAACYCRLVSHETIHMYRKKMDSVSCIYIFAHTYMCEQFLKRRRLSIWGGRRERWMKVMGAVGGRRAKGKVMMKCIKMKKKQSPDVKEY